MKKEVRLQAINLTGQELQFTPEEAQKMADELVAKHNPSRADWECTQKILLVVLNTIERGRMLPKDQWESLLNTLRKEVYEIVREVRTSGLDMGVELEQLKTQRHAEKALFKYEHGYTKEQVNASPCNS